MISEESEIQPGDWHQNPKITGKDTEAQPIPEEAEARENLVAKYSLFKNQLHPKSDIVYHPCGANDISPSFAFPDSRVIYVDLDEDAMTSVTDAGYEGHTASALDYDPGDVDILIMLNPAISPDIPSSHVKEDGYIVCNDYHGTASDIRQDPNYELTAVVRQAGDQSLVFDQENLEDYWKEVDSDEAFRNAPLDWGSVDYNSAAGAVEALTGETDDILERYKKLIDEARAQAIEENEQSISEFQSLPHDELEALKRMFGDPNELDEFVVTSEGRTFVLQASLPKKKGTVDDLFIFKKKRAEEQQPTELPNAA